MLKAARSGPHAPPPGRPAVPPLGFEGAAASIHTYEPLLIPGLLQSADYARAIIRAAQPGEPEKIERLVGARMLRQSLVNGPDAPQLWAILDEAVLHRAVGGPAIMRAQLEHLLTAANRPNVTIQVVPFKAGAYMAMDGGFIILRFAEAEDRDVVSVDNRTRSLYLDDPNEVRSYTIAYEQLLALAASPEESLDLIERSTTMDRFDRDQAVWRKSSRSNGSGGNCVEVAEVNGIIGLRDSKDPDGPVLTFNRTDWAAFVTRTRNNEFQAS